MRLDTITYGPHSSVNYYVFYPYNEKGTPGYGYILDDANDSISFGFQFGKTATISAVGLYMVEYEGDPDYAMTFAVVSGSYTTVEDSVPDVNPNTKIANHYSNSQWQDFKPTVVGSGWSWIDLATQVNVTKGEIAALTIIPSGAQVPNSTNKCRINDEGIMHNPYPGQWRFFNNWTHYNWESPAGVKYTDSSIEGFPYTYFPYEEYASPEEWGVEFQLPFSATCVGGIFNMYNVDTGYEINAPFKLILANSSDNELASITITDYDLIEYYSNDNVRMAWDTGTDPELTANTTYRLYLKPTSSELVNKYGIGFNVESDKSVMPGGTNWKWIERSTPASGWTYQPTYYPWLSVILTDIQGGTTPGGNGSGAGNSSYGFIG
jgi:hypothetical protein